MKYILTVLVLGWTILLLSSFSSASTYVAGEERQDYVLLYDMAVLNRELAEKALSGPPTFENGILLTASKLTACDVAYVGSQGFFKLKYFKSWLLACETLDMLNETCYASCER